MLNTVAIEGRVTRDLEIRQTAEKQVSYTNFSIANERGFGDSKRTGFYDVMVWGEAAERMEKAKVKKGSHIYLRGILDQSTYEKDGVKHNNVKVVINDSGEWGYISSGQKPENSNNIDTNQTQGDNFVSEGPPDGFMNVNDDVLPF